MIRDLIKYMPVMKDTEYVDSLFEIKSILATNENNDGRPILYKKNHGYKGLSVIMGGKIDNIYDIIQAMKDLHDLWLSFFMKNGIRFCTGI